MDSDNIKMDVPNKVKPDPDHKTARNAETDVTVEIKQELVDEEYAENQWCKETDEINNVSEVGKKKARSDVSYNCSVRGKYHEQCKLKCKADSPVSGSTVHMDNAEVYNGSSSTKGVVSKIKQVDNSDENMARKDEVNSTVDNLQPNVKSLHKTKDSEVLSETLSEHYINCLMLKVDENGDMCYVTTVRAREECIPLEQDEKKASTNIRECQKVPLEMSNNQNSVSLLDVESSGPSENESDDSEKTINNESDTGSKFCDSKNSDIKKKQEGDRNYICDVCNVGFSRKDRLKNHKRIHTGEKPFKCDICGVGFSQGGHLRRHRILHSGEKPFKCEVCGVGFSRKDRLQGHIRIHTGEKPYKCDVCDVAYIDSKNLRIHKRIHTGEKPYKCDICKVAFAQLGELKRHNRIHAAENLDKSGAGFTDGNTDSSLHTGERPFKCDVCGIGFYQTGHLKRHKRIHTGEKPFKCDVCSVGFSQKSDLKCHKRIHTGEKPFNCDVCGVAFSQVGILKRHKRIHTGEKPYKCDVCGVRFSRRSHLKGHKRVHTGEKPYKCDVCGLGFSQTGNLKNHKRIHVGEEKS